MKIKFLSYAFLLMLAGVVWIGQNPGEIRGKVVSAADRSPFVVLRYGSKAVAPLPCLKLR